MTCLSGMEHSCAAILRDMTRTVGCSGGDELTCKEVEMRFFLRQWEVSLEKRAVAERPVRMPVWKAR